MPLVITIARTMEGAALELKVHFRYLALFPVPVFLQILVEIAVEFQKDVPIVTKNVKTDLVKNFLWQQTLDKSCFSLLKYSLNIILSRKISEIGRCLSNELNTII